MKVELINMGKTQFRLKITSIDYTPEDTDGTEAAEPEVSEYVTVAEFTSDKQCEIIYRESEELGMGDTTVKICWRADTPSVVSVIRGGEIDTVMTFEEGKRHISAYNMPGMSFELCTRALKVKNKFSGKVGGEIYLDYVIEIRGTFGGRRKMMLEMLPTNNI